MEVHRLEDLVKLALRERRAWFLLLVFRPTEDEMEDWSQLSQALPWLREFGQGRGALCEELRRHGLAVIGCSSEEEAHRLFREVRGWRLSIEVLASDGSSVLWERSTCDRERRR